MSDKAGGDSEKRDATQLRRVADRILHKNLRLNEILLDSLPHPAMLISKDRMILAANHTARQLGAKVGQYCWRSFGQSEFIGEQDKKYIKKHKEVPPGGTHCVFCKADEALEKQTHTNDPEIKAWDKIWDMHWIGLDEETFLHYGVDVTHISREEERVRMSELKYRSLAQNIPGLVYRILVRQDNRMLFFNTMLDAMTGFKESELTKGGICSIKPHILAEDRDRVVAAVKHRGDEKEPFEVEYRFRHKNGEIKWFKEIGRPIFGPGDELLFIDGIITDITDHKRAEEALAESEGRFRALFEQAAVGVSQVETKTGRFLKVNRKYCDIIGYSPEEMMSRTFQEITHPEDLPKDLDNMKKLIQGDIREFSMEKRYLHKSGAIVWVSLSVSAMWGAGERPNCHIAVVEDITERKQSEETLRDGEEKWRSLAETAPVVIMNVSRDGAISFINRPIDRYSLEEVIGTHVYDYIPQDQHDIMRKSLERVFETGKPDSFEILGEGPEGLATAWYENHIGPILDQNGKVANVTMVAINITERKQAEEALRENEEKYRALVESSDAAITYLDTECKFVLANNKAAENLGLDKQALIGKLLLDIFPEDQAEHFRKRCNKIMAEGKGAEFEDLVEFLGQKRWFLSNIQPVRNLQGKVIGTQCISTDITERKRAEEALKESEEKFRNLAEHSPNMIFINLKGRVVYANDKCEELMGYTKEEFYAPDFDFRNLIAPEFRDLAEANYDAHMRGEDVAPYEYAVVNKKGERIDTILTTKITKHEGQDAILGTVTDITERKEAEEARQESELRFKQLVENVHEVFWMENADGTELLYVSPAYEQIWGRSCQEFYENPKVWLESIHPDDRQRVEDAFSKGRNDGTYSEEFRIVRPDGSVRWIWDRGVVIRDDSGNLYRVAGIAEDITERRKSQDRLSAIVYKSPIPTAIGGADGSIITFNEALENMIGYKASEISDVSDWARKLYPDKEYREFVWKNIKQALDGKKQDCTQFTITCKDGSTKIVNFHSSSFEDGLVIQMEDITERKRAEAEEVKARKQAEQYLDIAGVMLAIVNADENITMINKRGSAILGYKEQELIGRNWFDTLVPKRIRGEIRGVFNKLMAGDIEPVEYYENPLLTKDGEERLVAFHNTVIRNPNGEVVGVLFSAEDITERKRGEEEREHLMEELEATNKELQSIVYTTSHDLQTPLVNIKGFGGKLGKYCGQLNALLESKTAGKDTERQIETLLNEDMPEAIKLINAGTDKMRSLLDGLMYLSRVGEDRLNITGLDMNQLVENVQRTMKYQIKEKGAAVTIEKLPECMGDARQIDQVFSNLLDNALKYLEAGRKGKIRISGVAEKGMSIYCVEDNGIGIAPEHREKIFQIFYRLDPAARSAGEGLGLTIVERILDRNNGLIRVESEVGKGSKFFVSLPHAKLSRRGTERC